MAEWPADRNWPRPIAHRRWCRNAQAPDGKFISQVGSGLLHCAAYRKKIIAEKVYGINNMPAGILAATDIFHFATHISPQVSQVCCLLNIAPADNAVAADPYISFVTTPGFAGGAADTQTYHHGAVDPGAVTPDKCAWGIALYADVTPDSDYRFKLRAANFARILSMCCFEVRSPTVNDAVAGGIDPSAGVDDAIHDERVGQYLQAATKLWRDGGQQQLNFIRDSSVLVPIVNSASFLNIADMVSGPGVAANTPGCILANAYHNSRDQAEVPLKFAFRGQKTAGIGGNNRNNAARIWDGANALGVDTIIGDGWYTATGTLPATAGTKFDFQVKTDPVHTVRCDAICVWEED